MGLLNIGRLLTHLRTCGVVTEETAVYINHFSHNARPLHERLVALAAPLGYGVAYDGLRVTL